MADHTLTPGMSREQILERVQAAERKAHDVLRRAADLTEDPVERKLYERLAGREEQALRELATEADWLEAERFVQQALDV